MPKRLRRGAVMRPARVVAPIRVNFLRASLWLAGGRPLADDDVQAEILHGRIHDLLDRGLEAVDLIDEQDLLGLEVGQDGRQVPGPLDDRTGRGLDADAQLLGQEIGQARLAQSRRTVEQDVVEVLVALLGRLDEDLEVGLDRVLADEFVEAARPEAVLEEEVLLGPDGVQDGGRIHGLTAWPAWPGIHGGASRSRPPCPCGPGRCPRRRARSPCGGSPGCRRAEARSSVSWSALPLSRLSFLSSLSASSMASRRAVFLPMPGTWEMRATSLERTASANSSVPMPDRTAMASLGPMPETAMSLRKRSFSSGVRKP